MDLERYLRHMSPPRVKVCGLTDPYQATTICEAGVQAIGLVFVSKSPRYVPKEDARQIIKKLPPLVQTVGVFVDESIDAIKEVVRFCGLDMVQLHGNEPPGYCKLLAPRVIKAFRVKDKMVLDEIQDYKGAIRGILLDAWSRKAQGGTGKVFDWQIARKAVLLAEMPVILAGGLAPDNVAEAVRLVRPWGVDVSSGVESSPGIKDLNKVRQFMQAVNTTDFGS